MSGSEQKGKELVALEATVYFKEVYEDQKDEFEERSMVLGVGSGSTVAIFMAKLIEKIGPLLVDRKFPFIQCVPTSRQAEDLILQHSYYDGKQFLHLSSLNANPVVDLIVDGADEVSIAAGDVHMLKGGGGAMVMEKIVARASENRLYLVNKSKISEVGLGQKGVPVPIEVLPDAHRFVFQKLKSDLQECTATIRQAPGGKAGPVITDNGNMIIDLKFPGPFDPVVLCSVLDDIPGIVGHGIFVLYIKALFISDGTSVLKRTFYVASIVKDEFVMLCSAGDVKGCLNLFDAVERAAFGPAYLAACENCQILVVQMFHSQHKMALISKETREKALKAAVQIDCLELVLFLAKQDNEGLFKAALQCALLGNFEMLKVIFEMDKFRVYQNRAGLLHLAIQGRHLEVVQYLLQNTKYEPHSFVSAFKSATKTKHIALIEPFLKSKNTQYWDLEPRAVLLGLLSTGNVALLNCALENESFVRAFEACSPAIIREVVYLIFLRALTAEHAALPDWNQFLKRALDLHMLSGPITRLQIFDLAMELNRSWLLLPILHRCPNIDLKSELEDDQYMQIIDTRFLVYLFPFVLVHEADLRYLLMCVASHDYKETPHNRMVDLESVYDYAKNVRKIPMSARMSAAQHAFNISDLVLALRLIDNDDEADRLAKINIARESGCQVVERYLTGVHLTFSLHLPSDDHDFWLPREIKHYIVKTLLDAQK